MNHIDNFYKRIEYLKSQKVVLDKEIELLMNKDVETMDIGEFLKICKYFEIIPCSLPKTELHETFQILHTPY